MTNGGDLLSVFLDVMERRVSEIDPADRAKRIAELTAGIARFRKSDMRYLLANDAVVTDDDRAFALRFIRLALELGEAP